MQAIYRPISTHTGTADALVVVDWQQSPFNMSYVVELPEGVTATYTVQYTLDDVNDASFTPIWLPDPTNGNATSTSAGGSYSFPIRALQVNVTALAGGNARLALIQGSSAR